MGCGASKVTPQSGEDIKPSHANGKLGVDHDLRSNGHANGNTHRPKSSNRKVKDSDTKPSSAVPNGNIHVNSPENEDVPNQQPLDKQSDTVVANGVNHVSLPPPKSKAVAFEIAFGEANKPSPLGNSRPPRRLKKIESAPVLTREALEQKQAAAEQNRQKELGRKVKLMSKRRSELLIAREMDKAQQQKAELEEKLAASERKREKTQAEVILKQKRREEKAKRVRMRAQQMQEGDDVIGLDVDHDETYNADEDDESWDVATPQSASRSGDLNDNNNQRLKDKEDAEPKIKNSERRTKEQDQNLNDVYDFFDS